MPRVTELVGYHFAVVDAEQIEVDPSDGTQTTRKLKKILFVDESGDQIHISFRDESRAELIRQLTGGVVIPG